MCMTTESESPKIVPIRRVHELEPHVMPEQPAKPIHVLLAFVLWRAKDFAKFYSAIDWFNVFTGFGMYCRAILCIVGGMFMLSAALGHADFVEHVFALIGRAL